MEQTDYIVEFLPTARNDMISIISTFVMLGSKQGAVRIKEKFIRSAARIGNLPYSGTVIPDEKLARMGFRMVVVEKYLMVYRAFDDEKKVLFYHIFNGKTDYPTLMKRLYENFSDQD